MRNPRELAGQLLSAADLWLFVTTAARYADAVPWDLLRTAADRGTAVAIILDRVPPEATDEIRPHLVAMLREQLLKAREYVAKRGPGIHHVCFNVDDLEGTLDRCRAAGIRLIDETPRLGAEGKRIAFLHPSATAGVLVELSEY